MSEVRQIDANALMKNICGNECGCNPEECGGMESETVVCNFHAYVSDQPTIEPEVRHGRWIDNGEDKYICSACKGYVYRWFGKSDFCPRCSADMRDGGADNDSE